MGRRNHRGLDDLGSSEAVLLAIDGAFPTAALFAATHPSRTTAPVALEVYADADTRSEGPDEEALNAMVALWGTGEYQHFVNPDMPWNEENPGHVAPNGTAGGEPTDPYAHDASDGGN